MVSTILQAHLQTCEAIVLLATPRWTPKSHHARGYILCLQFVNSSTGPVHLPSSTAHNRPLLLMFMKGDDGCDVPNTLYGIQHCHELVWRPSYDGNATGRGPGGDETRGVSQPRLEFRSHYCRDVTAPRLQASLASDVDKPFHRRW
nr:hypothetical protein CFP56_68176 [Quercus suber]